ncbi:TetR/AcrR family transcriptional regulator [Pacificimonas sp. WHA3]|uniref:TetR/AcrR family transcriptional regulator n=1 Tax=Pacificimonas pallii TaxID=2827236 RepID=A0ABS6SHU2_9SPHN|nr:TetR/AcrR family transcriptional regulator [Pacificimonas pallii]MBV7257613.1 TetR/AcrR family transcriptional regulator [Pacificimonas pallii]
MGETGKMMVRRPRTARGERTRRTLLDAAALEFGTLGFQGASISGITRRAGTALGSFYTYFESKDEIFRALVNDMSAQVRGTIGPKILAAPDRLTGELAGLTAFIEFVREHQELYRIVDEAEFVDQDSYRGHYRRTVDGYLTSLTEAAERGEVRSDISEVHAWAIVGMNVFLGLRYGVWSDEEAPADVAAQAFALLRDGLKPQSG